MWRQLSFQPQGHATHAQSQGTANNPAYDIIVPCAFLCACAGVQTLLAIPTDQL